MDVVRQGKVRRAKLYYLRAKKGRMAKLEDREFVQAGLAPAAEARPADAAAPAAEKKAAPDAAKAKAAPAAKAEAKPAKAAPAKKK